MYYEKLESGLLPYTMDWADILYEEANAEASGVKMRSGGDLSGSRITTRADTNYSTDYDNDNSG